MSTQPGFYFDVVWESLDNAIVAAWFNGAGWPGWIPPGGADSSGRRRAGNEFDPRYVVASWQRKSGRAICAMRLRAADWYELAALGPPKAAIAIWARVDPFAPLTVADPENPTPAELYAGDVFYHVARNPAARDALRFYWPKLVDDGLRVYSRGVRFARFEPGRADHLAIDEAP